MQTIQIEKLSVEELRVLILETTEAIIQKHLPKQPAERKKLTKGMTAKILNRTLPTIDDYCKKGFLKRHRVGGRVYFFEDDVYKLKEGR